MDPSSYINVSKKSVKATVESRAGKMYSRASSC